jgi:hypothetical protein
MSTINNIYNELTGLDTTISKSLYFQKENKLVRISDHLPRVCNIICSNEDIKSIFLVFVGYVNESDIQDISKNLEYNGIECDYTIVEEEEDTELAIMMVKKFLNNAN